MTKNLDFAEVGLVDPRTPQEMHQDALWDIPAPDLGLLSESMYYTNRARQAQGLAPLTEREVYQDLRSGRRFD